MLTVTEPALSLRGVRLVRDERVILADIDWTVRPGERWVVLGRNGSGKTTIVRIASLYLHPSAGTVDVLGERLGRTDVRVLRRRIGLASAALARELRPTLSALDVVMTAKNAALEPWWHRYDDADRARALQQLDRFGIAAYADRTFGTLSSGEQQRTLLARTLMTEPGLVLLDEPTAGLDLGGREELVGALTVLAARRQRTADGVGDPSRRRDTARVHPCAVAEGRTRPCRRTDRVDAHGRAIERLLRHGPRARAPRRAVRRMGRQLINR